MEFLAIQLFLILSLTVISMIDVSVSDKLFPLVAQW